jgi:predicted HTH transcriptional regulator
MVNLLSQDADDLHKCKKEINDTIEVQTNGNTLYFKVKVYSDMAEPLMLRGQVGEKYSFCLLYRDHIPIRRWDSKHRGQNMTKPNGEKIIIPIDKGHKHKWDEKIRDRDVYVVDDIPVDDFRKAFFAFLKEENISFNGTFPNVPLWRL